MEFHPAANIFPMMSTEEFEALKTDIKQNGLRELIWTYEDKIIDGRNRFRACEAVGVKARFRQWNGEGDLIAFVLSLNLHRRHLTPSQLAMVGARAREIYDQQAKERQKNHGGTAPGRTKTQVENLPQVILPAGKARDHAGKAVGVSGKTISCATKVLKTAVPEVVKAVDEGRMAVTTAAILASKSPDFQRQEANNPKARNAYTSERNGVTKSVPQLLKEKEDNEKIELKGVGVMRAYEAINCLKRIPKNDALRKRGFQIVTDWIRREH